MILYVVAAAFALGIAAGAGGLNWWHSAAEARRELALAEAQANVDALADKLKTEAATKITDMQASYEAGEANAKTITKTVYVKGQAYVASTPVFSNPACVVPADGLQFLNSARAGVQLAAVAGSADAAVPGTGAATGRPASDAVPANDTGRSAVPNVQPAASGAGSAGQVSGAGTGRVRPKPQPIK
jgi:hypothetical protein